MFCRFLDRVITRAMCVQKKNLRVSRCQHLQTVLGGLGCGLWSTCAWRARSATYLMFFVLVS